MHFQLNFHGNRYRKLNGREIQSRMFRAAKILGFTVFAIQLWKFAECQHCTRDLFWQ
jgi:hypothetical protein